MMPKFVFGKKGPIKGAKVKGPKGTVQVATKVKKV